MRAADSETSENRALAAVVQARGVKGLARAKERVSREGKALRLEEKRPTRSKKKAIRDHSRSRTRTQEELAETEGPRRKARKALGPEKRR